MARLLMAALRLGGHAPELACSFSSREGGGDRARQQRLGDLGRRLAQRLLARYRRRPASERPQAWFTYHLYHKAPDWLGPEISDALAIPYIVAEASSAPKQAGGAWDLGYRAANDAIARADAVIGLNPNDRDGVLPLLASPERWVAMTPFVDVAPFATAARRREHHRARWSEQFSVYPDVPWLVVVAMMRAGDKKRSYFLLAAALGQLQDHKWRLLIAGDGPEAAEIMDEIDWRSRSRVHWLHQVSEADLPSLLAAADLFVWPAMNEAFGMALVEAQAAGLPVVAGRVGGVPQVVSDGESGLLVAPGDAAAFAAATARLLANPALRRHFALGAHRHADSALDIAAAAAILDRTLRRCTADA